MEEINKIFFAALSVYLFLFVLPANSESQGFFLPVKFNVAGPGSIGEPSAIQKRSEEIKRDVGDILYLDYDGEKYEGGVEEIKTTDTTAWLFADRDCPNCNYLKKHVLPLLFEKAGMEKPWKVITVDLNKKENFLLLLRLEEELRIQGEDKLPALYWREKLYYGVKAVKNLLLAEIVKEEEKNVKRESVRGISDIKLLKNRSQKITLATVLSAGLVDGINPCMFSTLVFFISLLSISKIKGRKLIMTGNIYCLACFLSYLALGFGLFKFLQLFSGYRALQTGLNLAIISVLGLFAVLSFKDAWTYRKTGRADNVTLQLPNSVKEKIHSVMRSGLNYKHLIPGAFFIGVLVTILESVCTGQVYVPILVLLTKEAGGFSRWFLYLLLYNLMFIIPLIVIFAVSYWGMTASKLLEWSKREVVAGKMILGMFFLFLAGLMIYLQEWIF